MTFVEIVNAVLADAFAETKRVDAKNWVNHRYTWLCDLQAWTFMSASSLVSVTSGSTSVTGVPSDFAVAAALLDQYGNPLEPVEDIEDFYARYTNPSAPFTGRPEAFTVIGGTILVGPTSNVTSSSFRLVYERMATLLTADSDTPILPTGYHVALVQGGKAEGFRLTNIPLADQFDTDFRGSIDAMKGKYLKPIRDQQRQSPAYRP